MRIGWRPLIRSLLTVSNPLTRPAVSTPDAVKPEPGHQVTQRKA